MIYGYEIDDGPGATATRRLVKPPMLSNQIAVSTTSNSSRFIFVGTRAEILEWFRQHPTIILENSTWGSNGENTPTSFHTHTELVIDLLEYQDPETTTFQWIKSYFTSQEERRKVEKVRVEIRPRVEKIDYDVFTICRVIVSNGVSLGEIVEDLERQWEKYDSPTVLGKMANLYYEKPGPEVLLSHDVPMAVSVDGGAKPSVQ